MQVGYVKFQHTDDKSPLKGAWSWSRDLISNFWAPNDISGTAEARVVKFYTQVIYIAYMYVAHSDFLFDCYMRYTNTLMYVCMYVYNITAHVAEWSAHSAAMCSTA